MALDSVQLLGFVAAACTTLAYVPQAVKAVRTRRTKDLSLWTIIVLCAGLLLWLWYGLLVHDLPLIAANILTLSLAFFVLGLKLKYG